MVHLAAMGRLPGTRMTHAAALALPFLVLAELALGLPGGATFVALLASVGAGVALGLLLSRGRAADAARDERRRVVRDLHDGAQQRLVSTIVVLKLARRELDADAPARKLVDEAIEEADAALQELRDLAHGGPSPVLTTGGLAAGVQALADRTPVPVSVDVFAERLPAPVEAAAYFVVAEALTNVAKHARARTASVAAWLEAGVLRAEVRDDGVGGADLRGHGLTGLSERVAELDGRLEVTTSRAGTRLTAAIPLVR